MSTNIKLCKCGCGKPVAHDYNTYIMGHNDSRHGVLLTAEVRFCKCDCGMQVRYRYANYAPGHHNKNKPAHNKGMHWKIRDDCPKKLCGFSEEHEAKLRIIRSRGHKTSEKTKEILRQKLHGNKRCATYAFLGKHHTEETKRIIGMKSKGRNVGEKSTSWRGGIAFEPYTKEFNKELKYLIRTRDGFCCQLCGIPECETDKQLDTHHVDYNKQNSLSTNLISICRVCNARVNYNRVYWTSYFRNILNRRQINPKALKQKREKTQPVNLGVRV